MYDRRHNGIKDLIKEAKDDFLNAIQNLDLSKEANADMDRSMLDNAIRIAFMILELSLYERIIQGQDRLATKEEAEKVYKHNDWSGIIVDKTVLKYLGMIGVLTDLQKQYSNQEFLT